MIPNHNISLIVRNKLKSAVLLSQDGVYDYHSELPKEASWKFAAQVSANHADKIYVSFRLDDSIEQATASFELDLRQYQDNQEIILVASDKSAGSFSPNEDARIEVAEAVEFPETHDNLRLRHGYTNLATYENHLTRLILEPMLQERDVWDVIVIGSGMGGGTVSDALAEKGLRVLVIEAGTLTFQSNVYNLPGDKYRWNLKHGVRTSTVVRPRDKSLPPSEFDPRLNINMGGMSAFWSGQIPKMATWELQQWHEKIQDYLGKEGGYLRAERKMHKQVTLGPSQQRIKDFIKTNMPGYTVDDLPRSKHQPYISSLGDTFAINNVLGNPTGMYSTIDQLLDSTGIADKDLSIRINSLVTHIQREEGGGWKVDTYDLVNNTQRSYRSKVLIAAAGCIGSTSLVMRSNVIQHPLLGKGLTGHPTYKVQFNSLASSDFKNIDISAKDHAKIFVRQHNAPWFMHILINYEFWDRGFSDDEVLAELLERKGNSNNLTLHFYLANQLDEDNFLRVKPDKFMPEVYIRPNPGDEIVARLGSVISDSLNILGIDQAAHKPDIERSIGGETPHLAGGMRMDGPLNENKGVVDSNLAVKDADGLYVCDLSVFPYIPAVNPALTLVALALRLADYIHAEHF